MMSANVMSNQSNISDIFGMEFSGRESLGSPGTVNSHVVNTKCFYGSKGSSMPVFRRRQKEDVSRILINKDEPKSVDNIKKGKVVTSKRNSGIRTKVNKSKGSKKSTASVSTNLKEGATNKGNIVKMKKIAQKPKFAKEKGSDIPGKQDGEEDKSLTGKKEIDQIISAFDRCSESSSESLSSESIGTEAQNPKPDVRMIVQQICKKYEHLNKEKDVYESKMITDSSEDAQFTDSSYSSNKGEDIQFPIDEPMDTSDADDYDQNDYDNDHNDYDDDDKDPDNYDQDNCNNDDYDDHDHNDYDHSDRNHNDSDHDDFDNTDGDLDSSLCSYIDAATSLANGLSPKCQTNKHNGSITTKTAKNSLANGSKLGNATKDASTESNFEVSSSDVMSSDTDNGQFCSPLLYSVTTSPTSQLVNAIDSLEENDSSTGLQKNTKQNIAEKRDAETLKHKAQSPTSNKATLFGYFQRKPKIQGPHEVKEVEKETLENVKNEKKLSPRGRQASLRSPCTSSSAVKDMTIEDFASSDSQSSLKIDRSSKTAASSSINRMKKTKKLNRNAKIETRKMEQLYIDVGQRDFGHIACPTCGMVYTKTLEEDSLQHAKYHQKMMQKLKLKGWKTERIVEEFYDGRIIQINPEDISYHKKKVDEVREVVDGELGFSYSTVQYQDQEKVFLFISKHRIVGCAIAVLIDEAYPAILAANSSVVDEISAKSKSASAWCCSSDPVKAVCGISRIWVLKQARRTNVASRLIDAVRINFIFGEVIPKNKLAFSDPTTDGRLFAQKYCGTQNILVFR